MTTNIETWRIYYSEEDYDTFNKNSELIESIIQEIKIDDLGQVLKTRVFFIEHDFYEEYPNLQCISCAATEIIYRRTKEYVKLQTCIKPATSELIRSFMHLTSDMAHKMVHITGVVSNLYAPSLISFTGHYECLSCHTIKTQKSEKNPKTNRVAYRPPTQCKCKHKTLGFLSCHPQNAAEEKQVLILQQWHYTPGNIKLTINLPHYLVNLFYIGDCVDIVGVVRVVLDDQACHIEIDANYVEKSKLQANTLQKRLNNLKISQNNTQDNIKISTPTSFDSTTISTFTDITAEIFTPENISQHITQNNTQNITADFVAFSKESNLLGLLVSNIFTGVYGNPLIKTGLLLSLLGGGNKYIADFQVPKEFRTLIIGEPGMGKTAFLSKIAQVLPLTTYVDEPTKRNKLSFNKNTVLCVDNIEIQRSEMGEIITSAMELDITLISTCNFKNATEDKNKSLQENTKIPYGIFKMYDMIFTMTDGHLSLKDNYEITENLGKKRLKESTNSSKMSQLIGRVKRGNGFYEETERHTPLKFISAYIQHARENIDVKINNKGQKVIKEFYERKRKTNGDYTVRYLECIMKITEAHAKMKLKEIADETDANFSIKFMEKMYADSPKKKGKLEDLFAEYIREHGEIATRDNIISMIETIYPNKNAYRYVEKLNQEGTIIQTQKGKYKINNP